jgi:hypothetical protein
MVAAGIAAAVAAVEVIRLAAGVVAVAILVVAEVVVIPEVAEAAVTVEVAKVKSPTSRKMREKWGTQRDERRLL